MCNEIQLTKNKMYFTNRKMKNHPPSPVDEGKRRVKVERWQAKKKKSPASLTIARVHRPFMVATSLSSG